MSAVEIILPKHNYITGETVRGEIRIDKQILLKAKTIEFGVRGFTRTRVKTYVTHHHGTSHHRRTTRSPHYVERDAVFFEKSLSSFLPKVESAEKKDDSIFKNPFDIKNPFEIKNPFKSKPDMPSEILNCAFEFIIPPTAKSSTDNYPKVKYEINFNTTISFLKGAYVEIDFTVVNPSGDVTDISKTSEPVTAKCFKCNKIIQIKNPKRSNGKTSLIEGICPECNSHVQRFMA